MEKEEHGEWEKRRMRRKKRMRSDRRRQKRITNVMSRKQKGKMRSWRSRKRRQ